MQAWLATAIAVEENRQLESLSGHGGGGYETESRPEMSDRAFFEVSGIRPQTYPFLKSERLKRERCNGN